MFTKAKAAIDNFLHWVLVSSYDPTQVSLTVKAGLVAAVPVIMGLAGVAHLNLGDGSVLTALFDTVTQLLQNVLTVIAEAMALYGIFRKIWYLIFPTIPVW